jgi:glycosyltransferase involved in cell wall biosynthesis
LTLQVKRKVSANDWGVVARRADEKGIATTLQAVTDERSSLPARDGAVTATVCICAHNEASYLADAVDSVMAQRLSADRYEVLVVDSASDDGTLGILGELQRKWGSRLRWVREDEPGLSRARNRGLAEAEGAVTAFIDADAVVEPTWLAGILAVFAGDAQAGVAGGKVVVRWDVAAPRWWRGALDEVFNAFSPSNVVTRLSYPKYPYGTNLALRTLAAASVGGFASTLGRQGRMLYAGEDGEMCLRMERAGWSVWYAPGAVVHHRTKAARLSRMFVLKRAVRHGRSQRQIERMHGFESGLYPSVWKLLLMVAGRALRLRCDLPFLKFAAFRFGYRWEGLKGGRVETRQVNTSTSQQVSRSSP